mmetsp:Transcript_50473/g.96423  ORF Transcript_50473/g.96423 Transcript_50473/m.96423 type:complete len:226 (-) Transcript_50473:280-957(-)
MTHLRSALKAQANCWRLVMPRDAPSTWPSSSTTRSQCTCRRSLSALPQSALSRVNVVNTRSYSHASCCTVSLSPSPNTQTRRRGSPSLLGKTCFSTCCRQCVRSVAGTTTRVAEERKKRRGASAALARDWSEALTPRLGVPGWTLARGFLRWDSCFLSVSSACFAAAARDTRSRLKWRYTAGCRQVCGAWPGDFPDLTSRRARLAPLLPAPGSTLSRPKDSNSSS